MKNAFIQFKKHWLTNLITFFISIVVGGIIFCALFFSRPIDMISAINSATLGSLSVLAMGLLMMVAHFGFFDIFAFGFKQMFTMIFAKNPNGAGQFHEYREKQTEKRDSSSYNFITVIAAGLLLSISIIVLEIIYHLG